MIKRLIIFFAIAIFLLILNVFFWGFFGNPVFLPAYLNNEYILWAWVFTDVVTFVILLAYLFR